jgi:hypothetical protein
VPKKTNTRRKRENIKVLKEEEGSRLTKENKRNITTLKG